MKISGEVLFLSLLNYIKDLEPCRKEIENVDGFTYLLTEKIEITSGIKLSEAEREYAMEWLEKILKNNDVLTVMRFTHSDINLVEITGGE